MVFFRTSDLRRDRSITDEARRQRERQLKLQRQIQAAQEATVLPEQLSPTLNAQ